MSSPIWRPTTQMRGAETPIAVSATGAELTLANGDILIDAIASWWVNLHGHAHPYIADAVAQQAKELEQVIFANFSHPQAERFAPRLMALFPYLDRVFFSDDGSTAVEVAIKLALQYFNNTGQPRRTVVALADAYHGDTFGAMSVSGRTVYNRAFEPFLFKVEHLLLPTTENLNEAKAKLTQLLETGDVAAFIYEPLVQGAAGMRVYPPECLDALVGAAKAAGALTIADEVMTGFGRTGRLFATDYCAEKPDLVCLSKGITGGFLPMGATLCNNRLYEAFLGDDASNAFLHGHSYTGNALAMAAANASLDLLLAPETENNIRRISERHAAFLTELTKFSTVQNPRQQGTILAFDLKVDDSGYYSRVKQAVQRFCYQRGVFVRPMGNVVYLMPPYCATDEQLGRIYDALLSGLANNWA